jgi:hypothetical protein
MIVRSLPLAVLAGLVLLATLPGLVPTDPAILSVSVTPTPVKLGSPVTATVLTTPDVATVQGHVAAFNFNIPKTGDGTFSGTTKVPRWAALFHGLFHVRFTAKTSDGEQTQAVSDVQI